MCLQSGCVGGDARSGAREQSRHRRANYRKKSPGGKKTSPLDDIHVTSWPTDWSRDLTDMLSVLARLVELEAAQADLLGRVLDGPLLARDTLREQHGIKWPTSAADANRTTVSRVAADDDPTLTLAHSEPFAAPGGWPRNATLVAIPRSSVAPGNL